MHRSRPFVLVILAAAAACSRHDPSEGNDILSQDRTLTAQLGTTSDARRPSVPDACGAVTIAAAPSAANQQQAEQLTQQAGVAEMHGDIQDARLLLRRAAALDGTNKSAAYHLGRTSEALGDRATAMSAYCRYLALTPTAAESTEARQRVAALARSLPRASASATRGMSSNVAAQGGGATTAPRQPARVQPSVSLRVAASAAASRSSSARSSRHVAESSGAVASGAARPEPTSPPATNASTETDVDGTGGSSASGGDVMATRSSAPMPPTPSRTQRRGSMGVQSTIIGVATGAILGAATGRSVKSTVIGAAAGGVLGTVVGVATRPGG